MVTESAKFAAERMAWCIKPCFVNYESPVVSQGESDCMTNCSAKAFETHQHFYYAYLKRVGQL